MTSTLLKYYNVILIVLCIGITLIHSSSGEKVKMNIDLYYDPISPPCRAVLLTLEALNLEFNLKHIKLLDGDQLEEDFFKINSLHTVPVIQDGKFVLSESLAIIVYLVQAYGGKNEKNSLYPNYPKHQSIVDQRLYYNNFYLYPGFKFHYILKYNWIFDRIPNNSEAENTIHNALIYLENNLTTSSWAAGESMTVADFSLVATITTYQVVGVNLTMFPKINEWLIKCSNEMVGFKKANQEGIEVLRDRLKYLDEKSANSPEKIIKKDIVLKCDTQSPQCRSVFLTLEALNLEVSLQLRINKEVFEYEGHPMTCLQDFAVIEDGEFILMDGHAIIKYLVLEYGGNDHPLYPNDPKIQAQINQILYFDSGTMYPAFINQYNDWIFNGVPKTNYREDIIHEALEFIENVLEKSPWAAGKSMTVADFSLIASISTFEVAGVDLKKYEKIDKWFNKCIETMVGYYDANYVGLDEFKVTLNVMREKFAR